jgi:hypothetical protein
MSANPWQLAAHGELARQECLCLCVSTLPSCMATSSIVLVIYICLINIQSWKLENPPLIISVFRPDLHLLKYSVDICLWIDLCHFRFCHLCTLFLVFLFSSFYLIGVLSAPSSLQVFFLLLICSSSIYWFVTYASLLVTLFHSLKHLYLT